MNRWLLDLLAEPRVSPVPAPGRWHDWLLAVGAAVSAAVEVAIRDDIVWLPVAAVFGVALPFVLFWRRLHPFALSVAMFGAAIAINVASALADVGPVGLNTMVFVLALPYAVFRWGSGRDAAAVLGLMFAALLSGFWSDPSDVGEVIAGSLFFLFPAELGAAIRYQARSRAAEIDEARTRERAQLARELHDTVAHHVSAIAIRAQAGQAVAQASPDSAIDALAVIEAEASRTLEEMRRMVGVLRHDEPAELAPQPGLADIRRLELPEGSPSVSVRLSGSLDTVDSGVVAALYRIAQESVTNARRHARGAQHVRVSVNGTDEAVTLKVTDDGTAPPADAVNAGYGIVGMAERAALLGGTLAAGPSPDGGWLVQACLPVHASSANAGTAQ